MTKGYFCDSTAVFLMRKTVVALNNCWDLFFDWLLLWLSEVFRKKKKSSWSVSRVLFLIINKMSVIYLILPSPTGSSGLPSDVGRATLVNAGLHDLTTPKMHSTYIAICLVGSYPTFSPLLSLGREGGYFLLHYSILAVSFLLGSRMLCVARTFLFYHKGTSDKPTNCFQDAKVFK